MAANASDKSAAEASLLNGIAKSFNNPDTYPDLKIQVNDEIILCHKMVLTKQSNELQKIWSWGGFHGFSKLRISDSSVRLFGYLGSNVEGAALLALLEYCYTLQYSPRTVPSCDAELDIAVLLLADNFRIDRLTTLVTARLSSQLKNGVYGASEFAQALDGCYIHVFCHQDTKFRPAFGPDVLVPLFVEHANTLLNPPEREMLQVFQEDSRILDGIVQGLLQARAHEGVYLDEDYVKKMIQKSFETQTQNRDMDYNFLGFIIQGLLPGRGQQGGENWSHHREPDVDFLDTETEVAQAYYSQATEEEAHSRQTQILPR